jgi:hypothetical protein
MPNAGTAASTNKPARTNGTTALFFKCVFLQFKKLAVASGSSDTSFVVDFTA